ncbi:MAG TPA: hypothetical protein EYP90_12385 [Chromatiaceae bacterium]|nr:hypothetical protein [Chromatiaceae bacterium]
MNKVTAVSHQTDTPDHSAPTPIYAEMAQPLETIILPTYWTVPDQFAQSEPWEMLTGYELLLSAFNSIIRWMLRRAADKLVNAAIVYEQTEQEGAIK